MADIGSPLAPGVFQGNVDALKGFADYVNARGGIGCRELKVRVWDSKLLPDEAKNGQIDACTAALALVGTNAVFNPDPTPMQTCPDKAGASSGLPDIAALAADFNEQCNPTTFLVAPVSENCPIEQGK